MVRAPTVPPVVYSQLVSDTTLPHVCATASDVPLGMTVKFLFGVLGGM